MNGAFAGVEHILIRLNVPPFAFFALLSRTQDVSICHLVAHLPLHEPTLLSSLVEAGGLFDLISIHLMQQKLLSDANSPKAMFETQGSF